MNSYKQMQLMKRGSFICYKMTCFGTCWSVGIFAQAGCLREGKEKKTKSNRVLLISTLNSRPIRTLICFGSINKMNWTQPL